jgi:uncharacterized protein YeaO (DUF488 family)
MTVSGLARNAIYAEMCRGLIGPFFKGAQGSSTAGYGYPCLYASWRNHMTIRIVRLGADRFREEGLRIGTVRRPPRGVPKNEYASQNWYDVWLPNVAPSAELMKIGQAAGSEKAWAAFVRKYRTEMNNPEKSRVLDLLAALSHHANISVGCYCENEQRCHRSILRELLVERGAKLE